MSSLEIAACRGATTVLESIPHGARAARSILARVGGQGDARLANALAAICFKVTRRRLR